MHRRPRLVICRMHALLSVRRELQQGRIGFEHGCLHDTAASLAQPSGSLRHTRFYSSRFPLDLIAQSRLLKMDNLNHTWYGTAHPGDAVVDIPVHRKNTTYYSTVDNDVND